MIEISKAPASGAAGTRRREYVGTPSPANAGQALSRFFEAVEDFNTKEEAMPIDHSKLEAWALCWPADPHPLLFTTKEAAEENRAWFSKNFKTDRHGNLRGEPFVLLLSVKGST